MHVQDSRCGITWRCGLGKQSCERKLPIVCYQPCISGSSGPKVYRAWINEVHGPNMSTRFSLFFHSPSPFLNGPKAASTWLYYSTKHKQEQGNGIKVIVGDLWNACRRQLFMLAIIVDNDYLLRKCTGTRSQTHQVMLEVLPYFEGRLLILAPNLRQGKDFFCVLVCCTGSTVYLVYADA